MQPRRGLDLPTGGSTFDSGFPAIYPDLVPQSLDNYFEEIKRGLENLKLEKLPELICEPGRAIVAESGSTIVRINLRKKQKLYINDGTYGTLFDAGTPNIVYPSRIIKTGKIISKKLTAFDFYGPTCDSMDYMKGPFLLPNNIKENDYIEFLGRRKEEEEEEIRKEKEISFENCFDITL